MKSPDLTHLYTLFILIIRSIIIRFIAIRYFFKENIKIETMFYKSALFKHVKQAKINERSYGANPSAKSGGLYVQAS